MRISKSLVLSSLVLLTAAAATVVHPASAVACGGFFCNQPNSPFDPPAVEQVGENVLFAVNPNPPAGSSKIEAHIQIFYQGPAAKFSWVLPVDAVPALDTGSDTIFNKLTSLTTPQFQLTYHDEGMCKQLQYEPTLDAPSAQSARGGAGGSGSVAVNGGVDVAFQGAVGPYDAAVIHSQSSSDLITWLQTNGYYVSDQATTIIDSYVSLNKYFVALRLLNGQSIQSIRPIILRFDAQAPCVPLRLTAIAASDNMRVNLWVLAASRTVPQNYLEITLNMAKLDWVNGGSNYNDLLTKAAVEAGGNAFTAEYAGTARIMDNQLYVANRYNLTALQAATTPPAYLNQLASQGFPRDAALLAFLEQYIPEPADLVASGVSEQSFYNQISSYWASDQANFTAFDPAVATDALDTTILQPLAKTQALFDSFPYMTKLATFISPPDMTTDPIFQFNSDLGDVPVLRQADAYYECGYLMYSHCDAPLRLQLPGNLVVRLAPATQPATTSSTGSASSGAAAVPAGSGSSSIAACYGYPAYGYARGDLDQMPSLAVAYQRADSGPGTIVLNNSSAIAGDVSTHNAAIGGGCGCATGGPGSSAGMAGLTLLAAATLAAARRRRRAARQAAAPSSR
jgi:MYXO-CTERM domain-containing protein